MISKMRNNINELVDFQKLKTANDLGYKWSRYFNIKKRDYMKFIQILRRDSSHYKSITEKNFRSQLSKDLKVMFYAAEIENILLEQYSAMIFNIMRKFNLTIDQYDQYVTDGYLAIRSATWQYRTYKIEAKFTTFVHKAIFMRIRGKMHKERLKIARRSKINIYNESDYKENKFDLTVFPKNYSEDYSNFENDIQCVIKECRLSEQESFMLISYINRGLEDGSNWYDEYRRIYKSPKVDTPLSRQTIYNQLNYIQNKIAKYLRRNNIVPHDFVVCKTRQGDLS
jgi:hypothetical protein